jgi:predicted chitinase
MMRPRPLVTVADAVQACKHQPMIGPRHMLRIQHFFTQIATKTGGMTTLSENLDYSAERIHQIWPHALTSPTPNGWLIAPDSLRTMFIAADWATPPIAMMDPIAAAG